MNLTERRCEGGFVGGKRKHRPRFLGIRDQRHLIIGCQTLNEREGGREVFVLNQVHGRAGFDHHQDLGWRIGGCEERDRLFGSIIEHSKILLRKPGDEVTRAGHHADVDFHDIGRYAEGLLFRIDRRLRLCSVRRKKKK